jgi:hypothetical protein
MNIARVIKVEGVPTMIIYPKTHGTHTHADIPITGTCFRYEGEPMPAPEEITHWLTTRIQREFSCRIRSRAWAGGIEIQSFEPVLTAAV